MEDPSGQEAAARDPRDEVQGIKETRGGLCYDLRPRGQDGGNDAPRTNLIGQRTLVFHGVDSEVLERHARSPLTKRDHLIRHDQSRYHDQFSEENRFYRSGSVERMSPHPERVPSATPDTNASRFRRDGTKNRVSREEMLTVDEWLPPDAQD